MARFPADFKIPPPERPDMTLDGRILETARPGGHIKVIWYSLRSASPEDRSHTLSCEIFWTSGCAKHMKPDARTFLKDSSPRGPDIRLLSGQF